MQKEKKKSHLKTRVAYYLGLRDTGPLSSQQLRQAPGEAGAETTILRMTQRKRPPQPISLKVQFPEALREPNNSGTVFPRTLKSYRSKFQLLPPQDHCRNLARLERNRPRSPQRRNYNCQKPQRNRTALVTLRDDIAQKTEESLKVPSSYLPKSTARSLPTFEQKRPQSPLDYNSQKPSAEPNSSGALPGGHCPEH